MASFSSGTSERSFVGRYISLNGIVEALSPSFFPVCLLVAEVIYAFYFISYLRYYVIIVEG